MAVFRGFEPTGAVFVHRFTGGWMTAASTLPEHRALQGVVCAAVLCGILTAGLWPFHSPKNRVTWLRHVNGLQFTKRGVVWSSGPIQNVNSPNSTSCSIEMWIRPDLIGATSTFLAFSTPDDHLRFFIRQYQSSVILQAGAAQLHTGEVLREDRAVFLTITSGPNGTTTYVDGSRFTTAPRFHFSAAYLTGELTIGTSPIRDDSWLGQVRGLAFYGQELTTAQVIRHYQTWVQNRAPEITSTEQALAIYLFNERAGNVVHNAAQPGVGLSIPTHYGLLYQIFLEPIWDEFRGLGRKTILINVVGFIPLGFVFYGFLSAARTARRSAWITVLIGAATSLTIEVLQGWLPTRNSGTMDLFTNSCGTYLGLLLCQWEPLRGLYTGTISRIKPK